MTCNWCLRLPLEVLATPPAPTKTIEHVCVSKSSKEQICLLCTEVITNKYFRGKLMISGGQKKTKACLNLAWMAWQFLWPERRTSGEGSLLTKICAEIAQTKIHDVPRPLKLLWLSQSTLY